MITWRPKHPFLLAALGLGVLLVSLIAQTLASTTATTARLPALPQIGVPVPVDRVAPEFSLPAVRGTRSVGSLRFRGHVTVLNFWASWCTVCRAEAPILQSLWRRYRAQGVQFMGVDHRDSLGAARSFAQRFGVTYSSAFDPDGSLATRYGVLGLPTTFVLDRSGRIRYEIIGRLQTSSLSGVIDLLLGGSNG